MRADTLVERWLDGRAAVRHGRLTLAPVAPGALAHRVRRAYGWLSRQAIHAPYDDLAFEPGELLEGGEGRVTLHDQPTWASFLLLPLLNLLVGRRLLFVGAPGRGKTSVATLMGLLAGVELDALRRATQRGHPQLTVADLLGAPLPRDLVEAESAEEIAVSWRAWLTLPVKIVDEFNRIPTKTQSALLSLMSEGCAEQYEQVLHVGDSAWYLTANDDLGGGTFPVIEALRDRIDVVVRCPPFPAHRVDALVARAASGESPEELLPRDLRFSGDELAAARERIAAVPVPDAVGDALAFFGASVDFCRRASDDVGAMTKDTLHLSGLRVVDVCTEDCPLDKQQHLCARTSHGLSVRAVQSWLTFAKALAWFRGSDEVGLADLRAVAPWVLFDKLRPQAHADWLRHPERAGLRHDRARFLQVLFDDALDLAAAYRATHDEVTALCRRVEARRPRDPDAVQALRQAVRARIGDLLSRHELSGPVHADLLRLRRAWQALARQESP